MKIMAVDFGDSHTGIAFCDELQMIASPFVTIDEKDFDECVKKVAECAKKECAAEIVVGNPINMNGTIGERSEKCKLFTEELKKLVTVPIFMWDERSTTVSAHRAMNDVNKRGKKRKAVIDAVAAAIILESYLRYKENISSKTL